MDEPSGWRSISDGSGDWDAVEAVTELFSCLLDAVEMFDEANPFR